MVDTDALVHIRAQFHSVQQTEGFRLLLGLVEGERAAAQDALAECGPESLAQCQAELKAWSRVARALGTQDGGGTLQDWIDGAIKHKEAPTREMPSLRVPGNR